MHYVGNNIESLSRRVGGGIKTQVIIKVTGPLKTHEKKYFFGICFMRLKGYLGRFRKSHKVSAVEFEPFGVKLHVKSDLGLYGPETL